MTSRSNRARACLLTMAVLAAGILPTLADPGSAGWLGVFIGNDRPRPGDDAERASAAVAVRGVVVDGPAARAGLRARDRILAVDGVPVSQPSELIERVGSLAPGSWIPLTVERDGFERQIRVRLDERPEDRSALRVRRGWIGLDAIDLPPSLRTHFGAPDDAGVMVHAVEPYGPAFTAGLDVGDVIVSVARAKVDSRRALLGAIAGGGVGNDLSIVALRNGARLELEARVGDADEARAAAEAEARAELESRADEDRR